MAEPVASKLLIDHPTCVHSSLAGIRSKGPQTCICDRLPNSFTLSVLHGAGSHAEQHMSCRALAGWYAGVTQQLYQRGEYARLLYDLQGNSVSIWCL